jgi:hypothetical protein
MTFTDDPRGLLVLNCTDTGAASAILEVDPLVVAGVRTYRVHQLALRERGQRLHSMKTDGSHERELMPKIIVVVGFGPGIFLHSARTRPWTCFFIPVGH